MLFRSKTDGYYENIREDIINIISDGPNKILEIGCGKGYTLKKLKELGKAKEIVGIEINNNSAECAKKLLDHVTEGDIEEMDSLSFSKNYFDYIIFADVLEHLITPWKVLRMVGDYLNEEGSIIATIPSLRHKSIILPLLIHGRFEYDRNGGSLDVSHLRFFTRSSVTSLFKTAGYSKVHFVDYPLSFKAKIATFLSFGFLKDFFVYKFREVEKCQAARDIIKEVDWDCEVYTNFREKNLGCKIAVSSGIDWFFEHVEEGIILEDDTLPSQSFFWFCQELLEKYSDDERVMHIAGANLHFGKKFGNASYYFSKYTPIWGWATWKRAWKHYDVNMKTFNRFKKENQIKNIFKTKTEQLHRLEIYQKVYDGKIDTWDYQWHYCVAVNNGLAIHPNVNLIQNIGFREDATHTKNIDKKINSNFAKEIDFPLVHPNFVLVNEKADKAYFNNVVYKGTVLSEIKKYLPKKLVEFLKNIRNLTTKLV